MAVPGGATPPLTGKARYLQLDAFVGQGSYGKIEKARDLTDDEVVAIKKVKAERSVPADIAESRALVSAFGIHFTVLREIKVMRELNHPNIIPIKDVYTEGDFVNLVMPMMVTDLRRLLEKRVRLTEAQAKCILQQILRGLAELHAFYFIHRDLAPANVFINDVGVCKVADFGLARTFGSPRPAKKTPRVVTLWYRAPELLYGANMYQDRVDVWSAGCIFGELLQGGKPLFPGQGEIDQLARIFSFLGTPSDTHWPNAKQLPVFFEFSHTAPIELRSAFPGASEQALDLLGQMLALDPALRISAAEALNHPYFSNLPLPCMPNELPLSALK